MGVAKKRSGVSGLVYYRRRPPGRLGAFGPVSIKPDLYSACHAPLLCAEKYPYAGNYVDVVLQEDAPEDAKAWVNFLLDPDVSPFGPHLKTLDFYQRLDECHVAYRVSKVDYVLLAWAHWMRRPYESPDIVTAWYDLVQKGYSPRVAAMLTPLIFRARIRCGVSRAPVFTSGHSLVESWSDEMTERFVTQKTTAVHRSAGRVFCAPDPDDRSSIAPKGYDKFSTPQSTINKPLYNEYVKTEGERLENTVKKVEATADQVLRTNRVRPAQTTLVPKQRRRPVQRAVGAKKRGVRAL